MGKGAIEHDHSNDNCNGNGKMQMGDHYFLLPTIKQGYVHACQSPCLFMKAFPFWVDNDKKLPEISRACVCVFLAPGGNYSK